MDRTTEGRIQEIQLYILQMQSYDKSGNIDKRSQEVNGMTKRIPHHENTSRGAFALGNSNTPPQIDTRPNSAAKCLTFGNGSAFVRASAIISAVGQKTRRREPSSMIHQMKWKQMSMCLVRA